MKFFEMLLQSNYRYVELLYIKLIYKYKYISEINIGRIDINFNI